MSNHDNSWFSDTAKTWMVSITMIILVGGMVGGYWAAYNWKQERRLISEAEELQQRLQMERIQESEHADSD